MHLVAKPEISHGSPNIPFQGPTILKVQGNRPRRPHSPTIPAFLNPWDAPLDRQFTGGSPPPPLAQQESLLKRVTGVDEELV